MATSTRPPTALERALSEPPRVTPLDALKLARRAWRATGRIDMNALAAELGTSRATLYRWVGSRDLLMGEVIAGLAERAFAVACEAAPPGDGPERLVAVVQRFGRGIAASPEMRRFVAQDPEYALRILTSKHSSVQRRVIALHRDLLAEQEASGAFKPALDIDTLAYLIVRIAESFLYADVITGGEPDIDKAIEAIAVLLGTEPQPDARGV